jgi:hypothetical protein
LRYEAKNTSRNVGFATRHACAVPDMTRVVASRQDGLAIFGRQMQPDRSAFYLFYSCFPWLGPALALPGELELSHENPIACGLIHLID